MYDICNNPRQTTSTYIVPFVSNKSYDNSLQVRSSTQNCTGFSLLNIYLVPNQPIIY